MGSLPNILLWRGGRAKAFRHSNNSFYLSSFNKNKERKSAIANGNINALLNSVILMR